MGGIEGAQAMEKAFNKTYGLNLPFKFSPGPAMPQLASRIIQEGKAGQPATSDLFIGSENHVARMSLKKFDWTKSFPHITATDGGLGWPGVDRGFAHARVYL